jgi:hypothetical protein
MPISKVPLGTIQKPEINKVVSGTFTTAGVTALTLYQVPAGKSAIVRSFLTKMGAFGSGTYLNWIVRGVVVRRTNSPADTNENRAVEVAGNGLRLNSGDTIQVQGNAAGNNEDGEYYIGVQEL